MSDIAELRTDPCLSGMYPIVRCQQCRSGRHGKWHIVIGMNAKRSLCRSVAHIDVKDARLQYRDAAHVTCFW